MGSLRRAEPRRGAAHHEVTGKALRCAFRSRGSGTSGCRGCPEPVVPFERTNDRCARRSSARGCSQQSCAARWFAASARLSTRRLHHSHRTLEAAGRAGVRGGSCNPKAAAVRSVQYRSRGAAAQSAFPRVWLLAVKVRRSVEVLERWEARGDHERIGIGFRIRAERFRTGRHEPHLRTRSRALRAGGSRA